MYTIIETIGQQAIPKVAEDQTLMIIEVSKKESWIDRIAERGIF